MAATARIPRMPVRLSSDPETPAYPKAMGLWVAPSARIKRATPGWGTLPTPTSTMQINTKARTSKGCWFHRLPSCLTVSSRLTDNRRSKIAASAPGLSRWWMVVICCGAASKSPRSGWSFWPLCAPPLV